jgi:hypothetical protein
MRNFTTFLLLALLLVLSGVVESSPTRSLFNFGEKGSKTSNVEDLGPLTNEMVIELKYARRFLKKNDPMKRKWLNLHKDTPQREQEIKYNALVCLAYF